MEKRDGGRDEQSLHTGHRDRMRAKFLQQGLEGFQEHEMLELALFYALPRVNTNEVAHRLLQRFGSLADVLNADYHALRDVKGMGESSAMLLMLIAQLSRQYRLSARKDLTLNTFDATCAYFRDVYLGETAPAGVSERPSPADFLRRSIRRRAQQRTGTYAPAGGICFAAEKRAGGACPQSPQRHSDALPRGYCRHTENIQRAQKRGHPAGGSYYRGR